MKTSKANTFIAQEYNLISKTTAPRMILNNVYPHQSSKAYKIGLDDTNVAFFKPSEVSFHFNNDNTTSYIGQIIRFNLSNVSIYNLQTLG